MTEPLKCPHVDACPGCPLLPLAPEARLLHKHDRVARSLARFAVEHTLPLLQPAPREDAYRTRAKLVTGARGALGLYRAGTHDVIDLPGCLVLAPVVAGVVSSLRRLLVEAEILRCRADGGWVDGVDVREARGRQGHRERVLVTLLVAGDAEPSDDTLRAAAEAVRDLGPQVASVSIGWRGRGPRLLAQRIELFSGPDEVPDRIGEEPPHLASAGSFVQAHRGTAEQIHTALESILPRRARVLEMHAGSGALALRLAHSGHQVIAVESFAPAAARIERAAADAGLEAQVRAFVGDAEEVALEAVGRGERFDAVFVDPPRRGLTPRLRAALAALGAPVAYVSCEPDTLARDLWDFARLGLSVHSARAFDMMPLTAEVESLVYLLPSAPPAPRVIYEDESCLVVEKAPHETTAPAAEAAASLLDRVRASGVARAVPAQALDAGVSGVCVFARDPDALAPLCAALARGETKYVALARGITRPKGVIRRALRIEGRDRDAVTRYRRTEVVSGHSLLEVRPESERPHQIRRHLAGLKHPVLGDARHGHEASNRHLAEKATLERTFLHCARVRIERDAGQGGALTFESALPPDLSLVLERLRSAAARDQP